MWATHARASPASAHLAPATPCSTAPVQASPAPRQAAPLESRTLGRRHALLAAAAAAVLAIPRAAQAADTVVDLSPGVGTAAAQAGDLVLLHYVGTLQDGGAVFDSTRGGLLFRDGGEGSLRPVTLRLGSDPLPGIVPGLAAGILGMHVGGMRRLVVPAAQGFGETTAVLAPYAVVPPGSTLVYEVQLLRLSRRGPDELMSGVAGCGIGGASERTQGCADVSFAEFL